MSGDFLRYLPQPPGAGPWGLDLRAGGSLSVPPGSPYPPAIHPSSYQFTWDRGRVLDRFALVLVVRGRGGFRDEDGRDYAVAAGQTMLVRPGRWHTYRPDPDCGWDERWLVFDGPAARRMLAGHEAAPVQDADAGLAAAVEAALVLLEHQPPGFLTEAEACLARALARLTLSRTRGSLHDPALGRAALRLQEGPTDIAALASSCRLSPAQFRRRFQAATGHSPRDYAVLVRLERAKELLLVQGITIAEVAERCGFCSASFFSRIFRRHCGCSPLEWRGRRVAAAHPRPS